MSRVTPRVSVTSVVVAFMWTLQTKRFVPKHTPSQSLSEFALCSA